MIDNILGWEITIAKQNIVSQAKSILQRRQEGIRIQEHYCPTVLAENRNKVLKFQYLRAK